MDRCGIYKIINVLDSKIYVGYATNFRKRKAAHLSDLRKNKHKNIHLQRAFNRDGEVNFKIELIEECLKDELIQKEDFWCKKLNTHNDKFGYNLLGTGEKGLIGHSKETCEKISKSKLGKKLSEEHCKNIGLAKLGVTYSQEIKDKVKKAVHENCKKGNIKLNENQVLEIVDLINKGVKTSKIAEQFNVTRHTITNIKKGHQWDFIEKPEIKVGKSRLTFEQINEVRYKANNGIMYKEISLEYNISFSMISKIKNNLNYGL